MTPTLRSPATSVKIAASAKLKRAEAHKRSHTRFRLNEKRSGRLAQRATIAVARSIGFLECVEAGAGVNVSVTPRSVIVIGTLVARAATCGKSQDASCPRRPQYRSTAPADLPDALLKKQLVFANNRKAGTILSRHSVTKIERDRDTIRISSIRPGRRRWNRPCAFEPIPPTKKININQKITYDYR